MKPRDPKLEAETISSKIILSSEFKKKILKLKNKLIAINS